MSIRKIMGLVNTTTPFAWDDSLSVYEMLGKLISKINEVVALVNLKLPDDFEQAFYAKFREYTKEEMQRILDSGEFATILDSMIVEFLPIKQEVIDARNGEVSVGAKIRNIDEQLAETAISVTQFGTLGVGNDTQVFKAAFASAFLNNHKLRIPRLSTPYELISNEEWDCPQIISDGAIINITGTLRFLLSKNVDLQNFVINTNDGGGSGVDGGVSLGSIFKPKSIGLEIDYCIINNVTVNGIVDVHKRIGGGIRVPKSKNMVSAKNIFGKNIGSLLTIEGLSNNVDVDNVHAENVETLVWLPEVKNASVNNLSIKNTKEQATWWRNKNLGVGLNGRDCLLVEGGSDIKITNIKGEFCIERPIYCQASNVYADNLESINCGGSKFVGHPTDPLKRIKNIHVGTMIIRCDDRKVPDALGQVYGVENIVYDNIKLYFKPVTGGISSFTIRGNNGIAIFNNIESIGFNQAFFRKQEGITDKMVVEKIKYTSDVNVPDSDAVIIRKDRKVASNVDVINELEINNAECILGSEYNARSLIDTQSVNKTALNIKTSNVKGNELGLSRTSIYGVNNLINTQMDNTTIYSKLRLSFLTTTPLYSNALVSNKRIRNLTIRKQNEANVAYEIVIDKNDELSNNILNYIKTVKYKVLTGTDESFETPIKSTGICLIKIRSKVGGYAEFRLANGKITELNNTGTDIITKETGQTPSLNKFNIYLTTEGFLALRDRIVDDGFEIIVENLMLPST